MSQHIPRITQKKIKEIINKLESSSIHQLPFDELLTYAIHRLSSLIGKEYTVSYDELLYRFCEVGPGNRRFDPLTVEILLNSHLVQEYFKEWGVTRKGKWFLAKEGSIVDLIFKIKEKVFTAISQSAKTDKLFKLLKTELDAIIKGAGYSILSHAIDKNNDNIEFKIKSKEFDKDLLLRFYNTSEWIYPDSWQVWDLFKKASLDASIPLLIAPKIHGACFPLFKATGILARATYGLFSEKSLDEVKDKFLDNNEKAMYSTQNIAPGKIYCLSYDSGAKGLESLQQLLEIVLPAHFESCKIRSLKTSKKINHLFHDKLKHLFDCQSSNIDVAGRITRIKDILSLKLGHLNVLQEAANRHEALIEELS